MDKTDIEKLQSRVTQDIANLSNGKHDGYTSQQYAQRSAALTMKVLWNMIQQLQEDTLKDRAYAELYQEMCDKYNDRIQSVLAEFTKLQVLNKRLDIESRVFRKTINDLDDIHAQETKELRTALELACESIRVCPTCHIIVSQPKPDNHWVTAFMEQAKDVIKHAEKGDKR